MPRTDVPPPSFDALFSGEPLLWDGWQKPLSGLDLDLVLAIQQGDLAALQRVIEQGGRPHRFDPDTWITPVALAAQQNFAAAVPLLLLHGDCPWHRDCEGLNAVHYAIWRGNLDVLACLTEGVTLDVLRGRVPDGVMVAVQGGHPVMAKHLLDHGWPLGPVTLDNLMDILRTGRLFRDHDEREDGPFAPGSYERKQAYPIFQSLIEQRLLHEDLNDTSFDVSVEGSPRRPRM